MLQPEHHRIREIDTWRPVSAFRVVRMGGMEKAHDFVALTRVIAPACGPDAELATLADAAKFVGPCGLAPSVPTPAAGLG
jgi:hypothetical protein